MPQRRGEKAPNAKLTDEQARHIRSLPSYRGLCKNLAAQYGVTPSAISKLRAGESYRTAGVGSERLDAAAKAGQRAQAQGKGWCGIAQAIIEVYAQHGRAEKRAKRRQSEAAK